jgi:hypothetical protein
MPKSMTAKTHARVKDFMIEPRDKKFMTWPATMAG